MTLLPTSLDDLTWAELMAEVRAAIPAESDGVWTLHAPVDPGITLLELYASQLEERLYWLDRIPDTLVRGILRLLDVPPPGTAVPASTLLAFVGGGYVVEAGTELSSSGGPDDIVLTTDERLAVVAVSGLGVSAGGRDRTADLERAGGRVTGAEVFGGAPASRVGVDLLPAGGGYGEAEIRLELPGDVPLPEAAELTLGFVLTTDGTLPAQWAPGAVADVPPPADLRWSFRDDDGTITPFPADAVDDGTAGLRRSGVVRLRWPEAWASPEPSVAVTRRVVVHTERATHAAPPRVLSIVPNAVVARHRRLADSDTDPELRAELHAQAARWLPMPGCELEVPGTSGTLREDPGSLTLDLVERDGIEYPWRAVGHLTFSAPSDRVLLIDRELGRIRFGDGLTGRVPVPARDADGTVPGLRLRYETGAGAAGNLGVNLVWETSGPSPATASNVVPVDGGRDPETVASARARAGSELARRHRAVTVDDHRALVSDSERLGVAVARVHVGVGRHPWFPCDPVPGAVTLVVVPEIRRDPDSGLPVMRAPQPDPGMLEAVRRRMATARLAGSEVFVTGPTYRQVGVTITVGGVVADPDALHRRVHAALERHLDALVGGLGTGWPFGEPLRPSELLGVVQDAAGTTATVEAVAIGLDGDPVEEDCDDLPIAPHELPTLATVRLRVEPSNEPAGGLS